MHTSSAVYIQSQSPYFVTLNCGKNSTLALNISKSTYHIYFIFWKLVNNQFPRLNKTRYTKDSALVLLAWISRYFIFIQSCSKFDSNRRRYSLPKSVDKAKLVMNLYVRHVSRLVFLFPCPKNPSINLWIFVV